MQATESEDSMARITEYVGADGVVSSEYDHFRTSHPRPGDVVEFPDGKVGRVWEVGTGHCDADEVHVCHELGSAFLGRLDETADVRHRGVYVDISGGPFSIVKRDRLKPTFHLRLVRFWNWGDRMAGADQGVEYHLARPVFTLLDE